MRPVFLIAPLIFGVLSACGGPSWPPQGRGGDIGHYGPARAVDVPEALHQARQRLGSVRDAQAAVYAPGRLRTSEVLLARAEREADSGLLLSMGETLHRLNGELDTLDQALASVPR